MKNKNCSLYGSKYDFRMFQIKKCLNEMSLDLYNNIYANHTRNDYRDLFKSKSKEDLLKIQEDIYKKIAYTKLLYEELIQKGEVCQSILDKIK